MTITLPKVISLLFMILIFNCEFISTTISARQGDIYTYRRIVAVANFKFIQEHNEDEHSTYQMYPYEAFIHLTQEEFAQIYLNKIKSFVVKNIRYSTKINQNNKQKENHSLKDIMGLYDVDLRRTQSTPVQHQGQCGNCYAVSTVDSINMQAKRYRMKWPLLSIQHLTDCSNGYHNNRGCDGGWIYQSMDYVTTFGLYSESVYPQSAESKKTGITPSCKSYNAQKYKIKGFYYLSDHSCQVRANAILRGNAITAAITAGQSITFYKAGILPGCPSDDELNHAIVIVGVSHDNKKGNYWIIKNSWGIGWGEKGYLRVSTEGDSCNICDYGDFAKF